MIIDIVVGAVVILSALISFMRGFIREVLTIAGVVGGILAAVMFGPDLSPVFRGWLGVSSEGEPAKLFDIVPMSTVADISAYAAIFVIVVIILSVISHFTAGAAKAMGLGPIDRTLGVIFGIARAIVLLGLLYLPFHLLMDDETKAEIFADSRTFFLVEKTADVMSRYLPEAEQVEASAKDTFKEKLKQQDILHDENAPKKTDADSSKEPAEGYKEDQREKLDELFKQPNLNE